MDADEQAICDYLKAWPRQFIAAKEICRRASGKQRFRDEPDWAIRVLLRMAEKGLVQSDSTGHYRLPPPEKKDRAKKWISPDIKKILEESGKKFDDVVEIEDPSENDHST
jgi:DNA topoisomerase IA